MWGDIKIDWSRNLFYSSDKPTSSTWRFRNRVELEFPLNRAKVTTDGARYLTSDWEWFVPIGDPAERFANKQRIRVGLGYRRNVRWRFEGFYIWERSRDTTGEPFETTDHVLQIGLKRVF